MRGLVLAAGFLSALSSTAALAQDNPGFNWTGAYLGVQTGGSFSQPGFSGNPGPTTGSDFKDTGFVGGVYVGHDWQAGNFVYGGLLSFDYLGISPQYAEDVVFGGKTTTTNFYGYDVDWVAAARARAGFLVSDQFLVYGTGGVAVTRAEAATGQTIDGGIVPTFLPVAGETTAHATKTLVGGAVGGGLEYAFTPNLSAKAEYTHYFFGDMDVGGGTTESVTFKPRFGTVTFGLSYRF